MSDKDDEPSEAPVGLRTFHACPGAGAKHSAFAFHGMGLAGVYQGEL